MRLGDYDLNLRPLLHGVEKGSGEIIYGRLPGRSNQRSGRGMVVYAVDIPEKADFVRDLGVDRFIDAKGERYEDVVGTVDLVLDYVGDENMQRSYSVLQSGGRYVTSLILS